MTILPYSMLEIYKNHISLIFSNLINFIMFSLTVQSNLPVYNEFTSVLKYKFILKIHFYYDNSNVTSLQNIFMSTTLLLIRDHAFRKFLGWNL